MKANASEAEDHHRPCGGFGDSGDLGGEVSTPGLKYHGVHLIVPRRGKVDAPKEFANRRAKERPSSMLLVTRSTTISLLPMAPLATKVPSFEKRFRLEDNVIDAVTNDG
jgi:hypothetical protein